MARREVEISISWRTIVLVGAAVAVALAAASVGGILLTIFVAAFNVAALLPVVNAMEQRFGWSRGVCSAALVLAIGIVMGAVVLVLAQAIGDAVRGLTHDLPGIVDRARHSDVGSFVNGASSPLDTLRAHAGDITAGVGKASGGIIHVGLSAFGAIALFFSVVFLTLFGLIDEPRLRRWIAGLMHRDTRERYLRVSDRIIEMTSRYMLGNLAISAICGVVYGITAVILDVPYPLALAVIAAILDLIPTIGATIAGVIIALVALSVSLEAAVVFVIVIVVYQHVENYILQPTIVGKAAHVTGFTVLVSVLLFGALFGLVGAIIAVPIAAGLEIVMEELTAGRRARIAAEDAAEDAVERQAA